MDIRKFIKETIREVVEIGPDDLKEVYDYFWDAEGAMVDVLIDKHLGAKIGPFTLREDEIEGGVHWVTDDDQQRVKDVTGEKFAESRNSIAFELQEDDHGAFWKVKTEAELALPKDILKISPEQFANLHISMVKYFIGEYYY